MAREGFGKLYNQGNELLAEGHCQIDDELGSVTLRPILDTPNLARERGAMRLSLDDGSELQLADRLIRFKLNVPGVAPGPAYRLYFADQPSQPPTESATS